MKFNSKHRKDKDNPYTLSVSNDRFYVSFTDGQMRYCKVEITKEVFNTFLDYESIDLKALNEYDRHIEHYPCLDIIESKEDIEDTALIRMCLKIVQNELKNVGETSYERFILHYVEGYSMSEIASIQNVSIQAVSKSIASMRNHLSKILSQEGLNNLF